MTARRRGPCILMYHGFAEEHRVDDPHCLFLPRSELRRQLNLLHARGWSPLDMDQFLAARGRHDQRRQFLVTIDDGYRSVLDVAAGEFRAAGVRPVLFVPPGLITDRSRRQENLGVEPLVTQEELLALVDSGFEIGVHGLDHQTMAGMSDSELHENTVTARARLADLTGIVPRSFAYPLGVMDDRAVDAVRRAGYSVAFSVAVDRGQFGIPRTSVASVDSLGAFRLKLSPWYDVLWSSTRPVAGARRRVRRVLDLASRP